MTDCGLKAYGLTINGLMIDGLQREVVVIRAEHAACRKYDCTAAAGFSL
jgi:hypothetical protein